MRLLNGDTSPPTDEGLLELLLTYGIPRRDVQPLAKTLLSRFGNLDQVLAYTVQLNSERVVRRLGNLGSILGLAPKGM